MVHGFVHLSDGSAVVEARVFFSRSPTDVPDVALLSDRQGRFTLYAPAPGHYEVTCQADGLEPATVQINAVAGQEEVQVDVVLEPTAD